MRKSARESKKPELFQFGGGIRTGDEALAGDDENDGTDEEEDFFDKPAAPKKIKTAAPLANKVTKKVQEPSQRDIEGERMTLFDAVKSGRKMAGDVDRWIESYKRNRIAAVVELANFTLRSAGATKDWIAIDVDLDALEPDEIDELLRDMVEEMTNSEGSKNYPLSQASKQAKVAAFRQRYIVFWATLTDRLRSLEEEDIPGREGVTMLKVVTDQLISLSSMALVNVRDAVTEAALTVGQRIVAGVVLLRGKMEVHERQMQAELHKLKAQAQKNPKFQAISKQFKALESAMNELEELSTNLFNSVLIHRLRDTQEIVRIQCTRHLGDWMALDPDRFYKDEYFKYIGWMCYDHTGAVRREAVRSFGKLLKYEEHAVKLVMFVERFSMRFVEIAAADKDESASLEMLAVMKDMQDKGLMDLVSEELLDIVDSIIFDFDASARVRQEALSLMMAHTEGFEPEEGDEEDSEEPAPKRGKSAAASSSASGSKEDRVRSVAHRQKTAMQLETLTEFVEHHLRRLKVHELKNQDLSEEEVAERCMEWSAADLARIELIVDACIQLQNGGMMRDWPTMISLLLRESDDLISTALRPSQSLILLHMLVASAKELKEWHAGMRSSQLGESGEVNGAAKREAAMRAGGAGGAAAAAKKKKITFSVKLSAGEQQKLEDWESLSDRLQADLPRLLVRFRDDSDSLAMLVQLLSCCDAGVNHKAMRGLLKAVVDLYETSSGEGIISGIATAMREWMRFGGTICGLVEEAVSSILASLYEKMEEWTLSLRDAMAAMGDGSGAASSSSSKAKKAKKNGSGGARTLADVEEAIYSISVSASKFKALWMAMDCRPFVQQSLDEIADEMVEVSDAVVSLFEEFKDSISPEIELACATTAQDAISALNAIMLWVTRDVFMGLKDIRDAKIARIQDKMKSSANDSLDLGGLSRVDDGEDEEQDEQTVKEIEELSGDVDAILRLREKLLDVLQTWMMLGEDVTQIQSQSQSDLNEGSGSSELHRRLQREAFKIVGDVRALFPCRQKHHIGVDRLAYTPSTDILTGLRRVFEAEGTRIKQRMRLLAEDAELRGDDDGMHQKELDELSELLVKSLLRPLSNSLMYDVEHLNRRQAAAVICYLLDPSTIVQETVKTLIKCLRDADMAKYLEVQLVALRGIFAENVANRLKAKLHEEESGTFDEDVEAEREADQIIAAGYDKVETLAKKLALTLGVGKAKGGALVSIVDFIKVGIDFALSEPPFTLGFVEALEPYTRFLPAPQMKQLFDHLEEKLHDEENDTDTAFVELRQTMKDLEDGQGAGAPLREIGSFYDFRAHVGGLARSGVSRKKTLSQGRATQDGEDGEDSLLETSAFSTRRKRGPAKGRTGAAAAAASGGKKAKGGPKSGATKKKRPLRSIDEDGNEEGDGEEAEGEEGEEEEGENDDDAADGSDADAVADRKRKAAKRRKVAMPERRRSAETAAAKKAAAARSKEEEEIRLANEGRLRRSSREAAMKSVSYTDPDEDNIPIPVEDQFIEYAGPGRRASKERQSTGSENEDDRMQVDDEEEDDEEDAPVKSSQGRSTQRSSSSSQGNAGGRGRGSAGKGRPMDVAYGLELEDLPDGDDGEEEGDGDDDEEEDEVFPRERGYAQAPSSSQRQSQSKYGQKHQQQQKIGRAKDKSPQQQKSKRGKSTHEDDFEEEEEEEEPIARRGPKGKGAKALPAGVGNARGKQKQKQSPQKSKNKPSPKKGGRGPTARKQQAEEVEDDEEEDDEDEQQEKEEEEEGQQEDEEEEEEDIFAGIKVPSSKRYR